MTQISLRCGHAAESMTTSSFANFCHKTVIDVEILIQIYFDTRIPLGTVQSHLAAHYQILTYSEINIVVAVLTCTGSET